MHENTVKTQQVFLHKTSETLIMGQYDSSYFVNGLPGVCVKRCSNGKLELGELKNIRPVCLNYTIPC